MLLNKFGMPFIAFDGEVAAGGGGAPPPAPPPPPPAPPPKEEEDKEEDVREDEHEEFDKPRAMATIKKLRGIENELTKSNKAMAVRLAALEAEQKKVKDAELTELQKAQAKAQEASDHSLELEGLLREERLQRAIESEASRMGFRDPEDAYAILAAKDFEGIDFDEEKKSYKGVKDALKAVAEGKPHLLDPEKVPAPAERTPPRGGQPKPPGKGGPPKPLDEQPASVVLGTTPQL